MSRTEKEGGRVVWLGSMLIFCAFNCFVPCALFYLIAFN